MGKFNYFSTINKKIEKLSPEEQFDLLFDLINAFALMKSSSESALLLQDLLTESELKNLAKRLGIAKLILSGMTQREISSELHCSFATVAKITMWLNQGGEGFRKVIKQLPERKGAVRYPKKIPGIGYTFPQIVAYAISLHSKKRQNDMLQSFVDSTRSKANLDKDFKEELSLIYKKIK